MLFPHRNTMDAEKLEVVLKELTGQDHVKPYLKTLAHWTKRIKASENGKCITAIDRQSDSLRKLSELLIVELAVRQKGTDSEVCATLTKDGEELSADFFKKGFYL